MIFTSFIIVLISYLLIKIKYRWFYILYKTYKRDLRALILFSRYNLMLWLFEYKNQTVAKIFTNIARKTPSKTALHFGDEAWTFQELDDYSNRVSRVFKSANFKKGDRVALLLESRPQYVCIWLGLAKIGVATALINTNLVADALMHSLNAADVKTVIYGQNFAKSIMGISSKLTGIKLYQWNEKSQTEDVLDGAINLTDEIEDQSCQPLLDDIRNGSIRDKLFFIYTSGTTGLPKAAVITNLRFIFMSGALYYMAALHKKDIVYDPLPLYHSAGGIVGVGQCILYGLTVAIRPKFSVSNFWSDCIKYKCTVAQYIGEICRYILAAHCRDQKPIDHSVRLMYGNGLRPQIWRQFVNRFNIREIYELYGATEGNSNLLNIDSKEGAVGFVPHYARRIYPVTLIKYDKGTGAPLRDQNGFCTRCMPDEPGIFIGSINPKKAVNDFAGYTDRKATEMKIIKDVFKKGDMFFNSGDILVQDELGYYYFKDRTGDTFRWKGENVATAEVEAVISNLVDFKDAAVYGVEIPNTEGRAGMVSIVDVDNTLVLDRLGKGLKASLPNYAIPMFVRVLKAVPLTGTFKLKKVDLQAEGFNIEKITDNIYMYDPKIPTYVRLTPEMYHDINQGKLKL